MVRTCPGPSRFVGCGASNRARVPRPEQMISRRHFIWQAGVTALAGMQRRESETQDALRVSFRGARPGARRDVEGIQLCWCPPGRFTMGSPMNESGRRPDEGPVNVQLTRGFWMARCEVTQSEWRQVVGDFPDRSPTAEFGLGDDLPVYWVNYFEAELFGERLTARAHARRSLPTSWRFRLPTEAEWEYACRAGTTTATAFGDRLDRTRANMGTEASETGLVQPPVGRATAVGTYPPNPWGLCDMHGNVFEWCRDWYHPQLPGGTDPDLSNTPGPPNRDGTFSRCRRGGAWNDPAVYCRSAMRLRYEPPRRSDHIGFRVAVVES